MYPQCGGSHSFPCLLPSTCPSPNLEMTIRSVSMIYQKSKTKGDFFVLFCHDSFRNLLYYIDSIFLDFSHLSIMQPASASWASRENPKELRILKWFYHFHLGDKCSSQRRAGCKHVTLPNNRLHVRDGMHAHTCTHTRTHTRHTCTHSRTYAHAPRFSLSLSLRPAGQTPLFPQSCHMCWGLGFLSFLLGKHPHHVELGC